MVSMQSPGVRGDPMASDGALGRLANMQELVGKLGGGELNNMNNIKLGGDLVGKNLNNIVGNLWKQQEEGSGSSHGNMSPRSAVSDPEPESPGDSGTDLRHDQPQHREEEHSEEEQDPKMQIPTIGIRSDLLPTQPVPKMDLDLNHLGNLQGLPALEALRRQAGGNSNSFLTNLPGSPIMPNFSQGRPSQPPTPQSTGSQDMGSGSWTFEEQFKQLYEIDDNPARREFLDELFAFMQKRGTPINRLPIMAKQVLDLFELFNLVVARGGLVEVINKKQWQEIIKGLGLPSSITSAAFTLRTQYTKYLYPWEMTTKNLSTQADLQNAIDGNKREGRRIESFNMPPSSMPASMPPISMPPFGMPTMSPLSLSPKGKLGQNSPPGENFGALEMTRLALWKLYNQGQPGGMPPLMPGLNLDMLANANHEKAANLAAVAAQDEKVRREKEVRLAREEEQKQREEQRQREQEARERLAQRDGQQRQERERELKERLDELNRGTGSQEPGSPPPAKRQCTSPPASNASMTTNLNIQSREEEDGRKSMEISMEINGIQYKGVLYARPS